MKFVSGKGENLAELHFCREMLTVVEKVLKKHRF